MNIYPRLVLVCGAIALIVAIWTAPKVKIYDVHVTRIPSSALTTQTRHNEPPALPPAGYEIREISPSELAKPEPKEIFPLSAPLTDLTAVVARSIAVIGSTLLVFFALKSVKSK